MLGYNINKLEPDSYNGPDSQNQYKGGNLFGLSIKHPILSFLDLESGINLIKKDYTIARTGNYTGISQSFINNYIQIPIKVSFSRSLLKNFNGYLGTGGYCAYWINGRISGKIPDIFNVSSSNNNQSETFNLVSYNEPYQFNSEKDRRLELGFIAFTGITYQSKKMFIFFDANLYQAITGHQKTYYINQNAVFNKSISFNIGSYMYITNSKKIEKKE